MDSYSLETAVSSRDANSSGKPTDSSHIPRPSAMNPQLAEISAKAIDMAFHPIDARKKKPDKTKNAAFANMHPAQRRYLGKKKHNAVVKNYRSAHKRSDEPEYPYFPASVPCNDAQGDEPDYSGCSASTPFDEASSIEEDLSDFDQKFLDHCAQVRAARDADDAIDLYFMEEYACCEVFEEPSTAYYDIPEEYSSHPEQNATLGYIHHARLQSNEKSESLAAVSSVNMRLSDVTSIQACRYGRERPLAVPEVERKHAANQAKDKTFTTFPPLDVPCDTDYDELCNTKVSTNMCRKTKTIRHSLAENIIASAPVIPGTVIFAPPGTGKTYASSMLPKTLEASRLPQKLRSLHSVRKIADSGTIVFTDRLQDCDERTIFLIPPENNYFANAFTRTIRSSDSIWDEIKIINSLKAVKFRLRQGQTVSDFLRYRMKVYAPIQPG